MGLKTWPGLVLSKDPQTRIPPGRFPSPITGMPRFATTHNGQGAPAATASSAGMPGADESGELADAGIAAAILLEAGGEPEAVTRDSAAKPQAKTSRKPVARESDEEEATDETSDELDTETETEASDDTDGEATETDPEATGETADDKSAETTEDEAAPDGTVPEGTEKDDTPEWAKRRFSEYSRQVQDLKRELAEARQAGGSTAPARPVLTDTSVLQAETPDQIAQLRATAEKLEDWAELNRDGVEADPENPQSKSYSAQEVAQVRINARQKLREIEAREKQLEHVRGYHQAAAQLYPGFTDPDSQERRSEAWILQQVPELRRLPNYRLIIGDALAGERSRTKAAQAVTVAKKGPNGQPLPGKPAATAQRKAPPVANGAPARATPAPAAKAIVRQKARERAYRGGSEADIANLVEASLG